MKVTQASGRGRLEGEIAATEKETETNDGHDTQIFFIGIGEDADMDVGWVLARATGAEFHGVAEDDLANLLAELSGYF